MLTVKRRTIILFLAPMLALMALINVYPIMYTLYVSFTNKSLFRLFPQSSDNPDGYQFVGVHNYAQLLGTVSSDLYYVVGSTLLYVLLCLALFLVFGLATALALNNKEIKWLPMWRVLLIVPWAVPSIITALIWKFLFHYDFGPINQILRVFLGAKAGVPWLINPVYAFLAVVVVNLWMSYAPFTVIILGALQSIPQELFEAASVDGATAWQRFRTITLPLLRPAITPFTILSGITTFQMFNTVYLVTQGGPITSPLKPGATEFVMLYYYQKVFGDTAGNPHYGLLSAFSVVIFLILLGGTILSLRATNLTKEA